MNTTAFSPISFVDFSKAAIEKGFNPVQYSTTGYFVLAANGLRVELQNTRGGQYGVGYRGVKSDVEIAFQALGGANGSPAGLKFINRITGSFNYRATNLEDFFALVELVGAVELPKKIRGLNAAPIASTKAPLVAYAGSPKAVGRSLLGELSPEEIAAIGANASKRLEAKKGKIA